MKKSIFDIISPFDFSSILDVCAGSGSLGIEAISRGAKEALFIERKRSVARVLRDNLKRIGFNDLSKVIVGDARAVLKALNKKFDLIFLDPPYRSNLATDLLREIVHYRLLNPDGMIIIESSKRRIPDFRQFEVVNSRIIGETLITYLLPKE